MSDAYIDIPNGWSATTIGELAVRVGSGITPRGGEDVYTHEGVLFIRSQNVTHSGLDLSDVAFIDTNTHSSMRASEIFPFDVLINITGASIGRCCSVPHDIGNANVNQHVCTIRLPNANDADARFLASLLASHVGQTQIFRLNAGGNREGLNYQQLRSFSVPWPTQPERSKIASILTTVDSLIEQTEALIEKYRRVKQGMMADLLSRGVDAHGKLRPTQQQAPELYKQSELGWIPKEWEVGLVRDAIHGIEAGKSPNCPDRPAQGGDWGVVKVSSVQLDGFRSDENKVIANPRFINPAYEINDGDLLISRSNTYQLVGLVCLVRSPRPRLMLCDKTLRLKCTPAKCDTEFLFWLLQQPFVRRQIEIAATGTSGSMKNISQPKIRSLIILLPPLDEQRQISMRFRGLEDAMKREASQVAKLRTLKTGLMQDLLTGRVRVKVDEEEEVTANV